MNLLQDANPAFWHSLDELVAMSEIVIDRAKGAPHPRMPELIYPLDYGFLEGTTGGDGQGIDVWLGSAAGRRVTGVACTVDKYKRDAELKVLVDCTEEDMDIIWRFVNEVAGMPCVVIRRLTFEEAASFLEGGHTR
jgi:inorganic pyrophosphatase